MSWVLVLGAGNGTRRTDVPGLGIPGLFDGWAGWLAKLDGFRIEEVTEMTRLVLFSFSFSCLLGFYCLVQLMEGSSR